MLLSLRITFPYLYINCVQLSTAGGRLIISSDGVWDALSAEAALDCCRGMQSEAAAAQIVKVPSATNFLRSYVYTDRYTLLMKCGYSVKHIAVII